ncbi:antA/AntB antirepressor family protein [Clostridium sporogenes]|uniref:antA/AntB antirepressor family protein n=1 Tax=Clostridium sporogenes TaxID=1509 RepID=UPI002237F4AF|nr:antA/AntB antirepressor family protein [Clostridium sporogenes]MCW6059736.1 antA/AntB antirepressor family protein [Clostridium sporogenes]MCW6067311.1 antA/AntB antirepressor family protein [Clostridium sporogenes]
MRKLILNIENGQPVVTETTNLTPIEVVLGIDEEGRTTARKLYNFLELAKGQFSRWAKTNILENSFAIEGEDYKGFDIVVEGNITKDYKLSTSFAKKLAMGTHNFKGEAAKNYFIKVEEKLKQKMIDTSNLSPELQMFNSLFKALATTELEQKKLNAAVQETKEEVQAIRDVVEITPSKSWRSETNRLMTKMCFKLKDYQKPKEEVYKALQERAGCDLKTRLKNMRARQALNGVSKSKLDELNYLDVIEQDKKLIEIYTAIVKDMAIKNGVKG